MFARIAPLLKLLAAAFLALLLIDLALFRSGVYSMLIKPDSTAGSVVGAELVVRKYREATRKNVLVLGNSQIGEGFSAALADAAVQRPDLHFINASVAGTSPRVWNYLLREVDPDGDRFAAIALMVEYDGLYNWNDFANYSLDISYSTPLLRLVDLDEFTESFTAADLRARARRTILLPEQGLHEDLQDFLAHPLRRMHDLRKVRPAWLYAVSQYGGHGGALPELVLDPGSCMPANWGADAAEWKPRLETYLRDMRKPAPQQMQIANQNYERLWLGRIAQRYHARGIPVIVFAMTRGPWKADFLPAPTLNPVLIELRDAGLITALPGDAFVELEKPQFFFDTLHLNAAGRERFSKLFAAQVAPLVH